MSAPARASSDASLQQKYDGVYQGFHWLVVLLVLVQYLTKLILPYILPDSARPAINAWHLSVGSTVLLVMLLRLAWRLTHSRPPPPSDLSSEVALLSRANHWAFYGALIIVPLLGWLTANAYGARVYLLGLIPLPMLVERDKDFAHALGGVHGFMALVLLALIALHLAGVLYHAFVKRDGVARRMLPGT